ncbi:hypothetical protein ACFZAE_38100 [Streptomyces scabiei]|uniref:hypothetical protein n=1 Tax=Streptomyces scabiei TaxID=1930 RepID=UPI0036E1430E
MADDSAPLIRLDKDSADNAPALSYNVPDPTSFPGRSYITLDFGKNDPFSTAAVVTAEGRAVVPLGPAADAGTAPRLATPAGAGHALERAAKLGRPHWLSQGDGPVLVREVVDSGVVGFQRSEHATAQRLLEPLPAVTQPLVALRKRDDADDPHDPPEPQAVLTILAPAEGAVFEAGENGFELPVRVGVTVKHTTFRPPSIMVRVNGEDFRADRSAGGSASREYAVSVPVKPGIVAVSAWTDLLEVPFSTLAERRIEVRLVVSKQTDTTPPILTVESPVQGLDLSLGAAGEVTLEVRGRVVDPEGTGSCAVSLDGADAQNVPLDGDGTFSHQLILSTPGEHELVVRATNAVGLGAEITRRLHVYPASRIAQHRLLLVECLRLSNYLGRYGAGRVIQTFSLLPGEKTSITIRSFESTAKSATEASSIFDSFSETTGDELTTSVTDEDTTKTQSEEDLKAHVNVKAGATWGWGSASVEAGLAYGTSSAREQLTKNVTNGASRHAAEKSSKRDIKVDTTRTENSQSENEQTIVRTLENTNLSRTLNFVFRQMTQEFVSLLHLVDVRVAHLTEWFNLDGTRVMIDADPPGRSEEDGSPRKVPAVDYEEVALPQVRSLLQRVCVSEEKATSAEATVLRLLDAVFDHKGERAAIVQDVVREVPSRDPITGRIRAEQDPQDTAKQRPVTEKVSWIRFDPDLTQTWQPVGAPADSPFALTVPGVILGATVNTLRTDGIVVDAFLGGGAALDAYSSRLQVAAAEEREASALLAAERAKSVETALAIIDGGEEEKADLWMKVFPPNGQDSS